MQARPWEEKIKKNILKKDKSSRGNASQFFVAGELCRRGYSAVVTLGNTPNTDILCSNIEGTKFIHIQVKTFVPDRKTCSVGKKAEKLYGENFFWVLGGIPEAGSQSAFQYFIIPASEMAKHIIAEHKNWLAIVGKNGRKHEDNDMRIVNLPPYSSKFKGWKIDEYKDRWDLIEAKLT